MFLKHIDYDIMIENNRTQAEKYKRWAEENFKLAAKDECNSPQGYNEWGFVYSDKAESFMAEMKYWREVRDAVAVPTPMDSDSTS